MYCSSYFGFTSEHQYLIFRQTKRTRAYHLIIPVATRMASPQHLHGVSKIIERLDKIYLQDTLIKKYEALDSFENYKRPHDVSVSEYILEFDKRYLRTKNLGTQMSDDLLAYRLLRNANLGDQYTKLVKATSKLEYEVMKQQQ